MRMAVFTTIEDGKRYTIAVSPDRVILSEGEEFGVCIQLIDSPFRSTVDCTFKEALAILNQALFDFNFRYIGPDIYDDDKIEYLPNQSFKCIKCGVKASYLVNNLCSTCYYDGSVFLTSTISNEF